MPPSIPSTREQTPIPTSQPPNHGTPHHQPHRQFDDYPLDTRKVDGSDDPTSLEEKLELLRIRESADAIKEAQRQRERRLRRGAAASKDRNIADSSLVEKENKRSPPRAGQDLLVGGVNGAGSNGSSDGTQDAQSSSKADPPPVNHPTSKESAPVELRPQKPEEGDSAINFASLDSESEILDPDMPIPSVENEEQFLDEQQPAHPIVDNAGKEHGNAEGGSDVLHSQPDRQFVRDARGRPPDNVHAEHLLQPPQQKDTNAHDVKSEPNMSATHIAPCQVEPQQCPADFTPADSGLAINSESSLQESIIGGEVNHDDVEMNQITKDDHEHLLDETGRHTPESQIGLEEEDLDRTPESVIRHPIPESAYGDETEDESYFPDEYDEFSFDYSPEPEDIPEYVATVRAHDGHYKIRPSLTLADTQTMAAMRREVSISAASADWNGMQSDKHNEYEYDEEDNDLTPTLEDSRVHGRSTPGRDDEEPGEVVGEGDERHAQQEEVYPGDHRETPVPDQKSHTHQQDVYDEAHPHQQQEGLQLQGNQEQERLEERNDQQRWEHEGQRHLEQEDDEQYHQAHEEHEDAEEEQEDHSNEKRPRPSLVKLDVPVGTGDEDLSLGISEEFDRLMQARKREEEAALEELRRSQLEKQLNQANSLSPDGVKPKPKYLMRQATKVVVASSRPSIDPNTRIMDNDASSRSGAHRRSSQFAWTTEPWSSGKGRRRSQRGSGVGSQRRSLNGGTHQTATQNGIDKSIEEEWANGEERGRLFVKVLRVRDLDLPLPRTQRNQFSLTLDNGMHCVTTNWLELATTATIGQEFELVVLNDLEFQLTLQMKLDPPKPTPIERPMSPARTFVRPKTSTFSRVFGSPKKRRELELRAQQEMEQQAERDRQRQRALAVQAIDPWELVRPLVAKDGSFGRAYIALSEHEKAAFGRPYSTQVACFNEWATEPTAAGATIARYGKKISSANLSMAPTPPPQRRPPYRIGTIELQLLYVPKPKGAEDKDMPKSMNAAIREMAEAENTATKSWKGFLSQQGGDCPYWRRRFFKLQGSKLTAYHESTLQPRATINLAKAAKLVDDRSVLTQKDTSTKGGGRRRSAFAEDEEGYMFVEEG
ncbi:Bud site selection protein bud4, partial [Ascosphaera aggregata]